jgi:uncharacterized protein YlxW (UPF0749 family)
MKWKHIFGRSDPPGNQRGRNNKEELLRQVLANQETLMSAISEFKARVDARFDAIGSGIDAVQQDVSWLKAKIEELQNSSGQITPADQALLDEIEARVAGLSERVASLDAQTDTAPAPEPPTA